MPHPRNCFVRRTYEKASCSRNPLDFMRKDISFADFSSSSRWALGHMMCVGGRVCVSVCLSAEAYIRIRLGVFHCVYGM